MERGMARNFLLTFATAIISACVIFPCPAAAAEGKKIGNRIGSTLVVIEQENGLCFTQYGDRISTLNSFQIEKKEKAKRKNRALEKKAAPQNNNEAFNASSLNRTPPSFWSIDYQGPQPLFSPVSPRQIELIQPEEKRGKDIPGTLSFSAKDL